MNTIRCPQCNLTNWATAISCKRCGNLFQEVTPSSQPLNSFGGDSQQASFSSQTQSFPSPPYQQTSYQQPNYGQNNYYQPYSQPANQKQGMAIASLILGIVGCFITAPVGLILGIVSVKRANKHPFEFGGKGLAIAGIILNVLQLLALPIIAAIAIPNLLAARRSANEASAIYSVRNLVGAEETYRATVGAGKCGDLSQLGKTGLIDQVLSSGIKSGYKFTIVTTPFGCEIHATPAVTEGASATGIRSFYSTNEDNWEIHYASKKGLMADGNDPILERYNPPKQGNAPRIASQK